MAGRPRKRKSAPLELAATLCFYFIFSLKLLREEKLKCSRACEGPSLKDERQRKMQNETKESDEQLGETFPPPSQYAQYIIIRNIIIIIIREGY